MIPGVAERVARPRPQVDAARPFDDPSHVDRLRLRAALEVQAELVRPFEPHGPVVGLSQPAVLGGDGLAELPSRPKARPSWVRVGLGHDPSLFLHLFVCIC